MTEKRVFLVSMGVGWRGDQSSMRVFMTRKGACDWVEEHFKENIKILHSHPEDGFAYGGLKIGNTFEIQELILDEGSK